MRWLNIGCGPFMAPSPWINVDVIENEHIKPDVLHDPTKPLPFPDGCAARVYLGHMLEHMPWPAVGPFLKDVQRVMAVGGQILVVGPDVLKTIQLWHEGAEPWEQVREAIEDDQEYQWTNVNEQAGWGTWDAARHWWNCYERRLVDLLTETGFRGVTPKAVVEEAAWKPWPLTSFAPHQCAVLAHL